MIRYSLHCERGHAFESWFQSSSAYEAQEKRKLVNCPVCGSAKVETARKTVPSLQHGRRFGIADPKAGPEHLHLVRGSA